MGNNISYQEKEIVNKKEKPKDEELTRKEKQKLKIKFNKKIKKQYVIV